MKKRYRFTAMVLLMLAVLYTQAAAAQTTDAQGGSPVPGVSLEAFGEALMEDRLQMTPVAWTTQVDTEEKAMPLSLSPDGKTLLVMSVAGPRLFDLSADEYTRLIVPDWKQTNLPVEAVQQLFATPEANAISWSPDGRYLSFAFPAKVYRTLVGDGNIWIAHTKTGVAKALVELPPKINMITGLPPEGVPARAVFDLVEPVLYYERFMDAREGGDISWNRFYRYDPETGQSTILAGGVPVNMVTKDYRLFAQEGRVLTSVASYSAEGEGAGYALLSMEEDTRYTLTQEGAGAAFFQRANILDFRNGRAISTAYSDSTAYSEVLGGMPPMAVATLGSAGISVEAFAWIEPEADTPYGRLMPVLPDTMEDQHVREEISDRIERELFSPRAAVFSPDGKYLLLGVIVSKEPRLYLYDIRKGVCGQVGILLDNPMKETAFADGAMELRLPGMIWAENNRLLLFDGEMCRLFELGIAQ